MLSNGARVVLHGLDKKPELNGLAGYTTTKTPSGRWVVRLDKRQNSSPVVAVKPEHLQIIPKETLAARHLLQLCAVQRAVPLKNLKQTVWSFIREPALLALVSFQKLDSDTRRTTVQLVSLQNARTIQTFCSDMSYFEFDRMRFSLRGPSSVVGIDNLYWQECYGFEDPDHFTALKPCWLHVDKESGSFMLSPWRASEFQKWICGTKDQKSAGLWKQYSAFSVDVGQAITFMTVASLEGSWIARLCTYQYGCWVYDAVTGLKVGELIGKEASDLGLSAYVWGWLAAHENLLVVSQITKLICLKVARSSTSDLAEVSVLAQIRLDHCDIGGLSLSCPLIAMICPGGSSLHLYRIKMSEPSHASDVAQLYPHSLDMFCSISFTNDKLVTFEASRRKGCGEGASAGEIVVRDLAQPLGAPLLIIPTDCRNMLNFAACLSGNCFVFCGRHVNGLLSMLHLTAQGQDSPVENETIKEIREENMNERPTKIGEREAAEVVAAQESDFVQQLAQKDWHRSETEGPSCKASHDNILLLKFNRNPKPVFDALRTSIALRKCRQALEAEGHAWELPSGGLVFVGAEDYRAVMLALNNTTLRSSHVIVAESLEYLIEESLQPLEGQCQGGWARFREELEITIESWSHAASSGTERDPQFTVSAAFDVQRTFICAVPEHPNPPATTKSTTDADARLGPNPRGVPYAFDFEP